jgi:catechol 2,3-dioxygenase-like lactoylglutathione lyase family enzyme
MLGSKDIIAFIPTRDKAKSRAFYETVLGLEYKEEDPFAITMNGNGVAIRIVDVGQFTPATYTILGWAVEDIREAVITLRAKRVEFESYEGMEHDDLGIWTAPDGARIAWFKDVDGNVLSISQDTD